MTDPRGSHGGDLPDRQVFENLWIDEGLSREDVMAALDITEYQFKKAQNKYDLFKTDPCTKATVGLAAKLERMGRESSGETVTDGGEEPEDTDTWGGPEVDA